MTDRYALLKSVCKKAGEFALNHFRHLSSLTVEFKGVQDMVSRADKETEQLIRKAIQQAFPDDSLMGEEYGLEQKKGGEGYIWIIDPIDGTSCFLNGLPSWCVSIGLAKGTELVGGAVFDPCSNELFHAYKGQGAWVNQERILPRPALSIQNSFFCLGYKPSIDYKIYLKILESITAANGSPFRNGSGSLGAVYAAAYRIAVFYEVHINSWDICGALAIAQESGCYANDYLTTSSLLNGGEILICAPHLEHEAKTIVNGQQS